MVTAGFKWAPLVSAETKTPIKTAIPQARDIPVQPESLPLVPFKTKLATIPFPIKMSNAVPINSKIYVIIVWLDFKSFKIIKIEEL